LIPPQSSDTAGRPPLAPTELRSLFATSDEDGAPLREQLEADEIQVPAIEQKKNARRNSITCAKIV
jgi:hypothetical protein